MSKVILISMSIFTTIFIGSLNAGAQAMDLTRYQWKNRLLFLFAPDRSHPMYDALQKSLAARDAEVSDRDLVVFKILETAASRSGRAASEPGTAHLLRKKFDVQPGDFRVILVGKDGGVKLDRKDKVELQRIFELIDSMPMRREEMRQKARQKP